MALLNSDEQHDRYSTANACTVCVKTVIIEWMRTKTVEAKEKVEGFPAYSYFKSLGFEEEYKLVFAHGVRSKMKRTFATFDVEFSDRSCIESNFDRMVFIADLNESK